MASHLSLGLFRTLKWDRHVLDAATTTGVGATPIAAPCTHGLLLCDAPPCLSCCKGHAPSRGYPVLNASAAISTNGGRPPQVKVAAQHRRFGTYRLGNDHARGANFVLYRVDTRGESSYPFFFFLPGTETGHLREKNNVGANNH